LPINIPVIPANPEEKPITSEDARLRFLGNRSCEILIHKGIDEIRKKPVIINKITPIFTGVLNIRITRGITNMYAICMITCLLSLSEK